MGKVKFSFNIPDWLYRYRWSNVKNYLAYQLHPYRCSECKVKLPFDHFDIWCDAKYPLKHKLGIAPPHRMTICPSCLKKLLNEAVNRSDFKALQKKDSYNVSYYCECCEEKKPAYKWINVSNEMLDNIKFCTCGSWNGHYVCLDCVRTALEFGEMDSHASHYMGDKFYSINGYGLPVINGKVRFPK